MGLIPLMAISIVGRLFPIIIDYLVKGKDWRNIRLGDIEDTKHFKELEDELRKNK